MDAERVFKAANAKKAKELKTRVEASKIADANKAGGQLNRKASTVDDLETPRARNAYARFNKTPPLRHDLEPTRKAAFPYQPSRRLVTTAAAATTAQSLEIPLSHEE